MGWMTIKEAKVLGFSKSVLYRQVKEQTIPTKQDSQDRTLIWIPESAEGRHSHERESWKQALYELIESHQRELDSHERERDSQRRERLRWAELVAGLESKVEALTEELSRVSTELQGSRESKPNKEPTRPRSQKQAPKEGGRSRPIPAEHAEILRQVDNAWTGTLRDLERQAGLSKRWLTKARMGLRSGPRSVDQWQRLRSFLKNLESEAA